MKILLSLFFQSVFLLEYEEVLPEISKAQRRMEQLKQVIYFYFNLHAVGSFNFT